MRRVYVCCLAVFCLALLPVFARGGNNASSIPGPVPAQVVRVVDGDTLMVRARIWVGQEVETLVRVTGIDAPETGTRAKCPGEREKAEQATAMMAELVAGGNVRLFNVQPDKYGGRVLARVENAQGQDVAKSLLERGLVRPYGGATRAPWCG